MIAVSLEISCNGREFIMYCCRHRYRRQDEIGTPWCVTVDFDTARDASVTVRERDTAMQGRVDVASLLKNASTMRYDAFDKWLRTLLSPPKSP